MGLVREPFEKGLSKISKTKINFFKLQKQKMGFVKRNKKNAPLGAFFCAINLS